MPTGPAEAGAGSGEAPATDPTTLAGSPPAWGPPPTAWGPPPSWDPPPPAWGPPPPAWGPPPPAWGAPPSAWGPPPGPTWGQPTGPAWGSPPTWGAPSAPGWGPPNAWGPPPLAWATRSTWYSPQPRARLPIVAAVLAISVGISFFLPWANFGVTLSDLQSFSISLMTMFNEGNWPSHLWPDLVVFGFLLALGSSLVDVAGKPGRRVAIVEAFAFAMTAAGVVIAVTSGFADWPFGKAGTFGFSPSLGAWLCLMIAAVGAVVAVVRFVEPDAFTPRPHIPGAVAGTARPLPFHTSVPSAPPMPAAPPVSADAPHLSAPGGNLQIVVNGQATWRAVGVGEALVVGRDPAADIVLADPWASPRHTSIERAGPGWLVRGLDPENPTWILDATGRAHPIDGELGLRSGELVIGGAQVRLYPPD